MLDEAQKLLLNRCAQHTFTNSKLSLECLIRSCSINKLSIYLFRIFSHLLNASFSLIQLSQRAGNRNDDNCEGIFKLHNYRLLLSNIQINRIFRFIISHVANHLQVSIVIYVSVLSFSCIFTCLENRVIPTI